MNPYVALILAVVSETIGTTALKASEGFSRTVPTVGMVLGYGLSFWLMTFAMKVMPVGVVYAIWSGLGIVLISGLAFVVFGERLDLPAVIGLGLILAGILVINLFSKSGH